MKGKPMEKKVFSKDELAQAAEVLTDRVKALEEDGLFSPSGLTAGEVPFYEEEKLEELAKLIQLLELGYNAAEVKKILDKVGVPGSKRRRGSRGLFLTVGELAEKTGVGARTIKHWEEKGIIFPDTRSDGGFRLYSKYYVFLVELIKDLQNFGYKLEEIKEIADLFRLFVAVRDDPSGRKPEENLEHLGVMSEKIDELLSHTGKLKKGIRRWEKLLDEKRREISRLKERIRRSEQERSKKERRSEALGKLPMPTPVGEGGGIS